MAITEKFGQAVIGSEDADAGLILARIHHPQINIASAFRPQDPRIGQYLRGLDVENRYMRPTPEDPNPEYGIEPAYLSYRAGADRLEIASGEIPEGAGRTEFLGHIKDSARIYSEVTGFDDVQVMWRVLGQSKKGLGFHIDNDVTLRGLETILGNARTLWLPDCYADWNNYWCMYDDQGRANSNCLKTTFNDLARLEQVDEHHMTIHKGGAFPNPLFHSAAGLCPELDMFPGTRSILTYDQQI